MTDHDDKITLKFNVSAEDAEEISDAMHEGRPVTLHAKIALPPETLDGIDAILNAPEEAHMPELVELAGLDPSEDLVGMDMRGVTWGAADLSGYNLSRCNLTGSDFSDANVEGMVFDDAVLDDVIWPEGYIPYVGNGMRH